MTLDLGPRRLTTRRRVFGLFSSAAVLGAALSPVIAAAPASAAACTGSAFTASSGADLLKVSVDTRALGIPLDPIADVRLSSTQSQVDSTKKIKATTNSDHLDASLIGIKIPSVVLDSHVSQAAPPDHQAPTVSGGPALDIGALSAGIGKLNAFSHWEPGLACGETGLINKASSNVAEAAVLPNAIPGRTEAKQTGIVLLPQEAFSETNTSVVAAIGGRSRGVAADAAMHLADVKLFAGTPQEISIKVLSPPRLRAVAAGKNRSYVQYDAPILQVTLPDGKVLRLDSPGQAQEIGIPLSPTGKPEHTSVPGVPNVVPARPVTDLVKGLTGTLLGQKKESGLAPADLPSALVVKLALGPVDSKVTDTTVTAKASALRIQVLPRGGKTEASAGALADVNLGELMTSASAPVGGIGPNGPATLGKPTKSAPGKGNPGPGAGGDNGGNQGGQAAAETNLPTTGYALTGLIAAAMLLVVAGRFAIVVAKRHLAPTDG